MGVSIPDFGSVYNNVGRYPSYNDYQAQAAEQQSNQLGLKLKQAQLDQLPLHEQMLRLQLAGADLANQQAQRKAGILGQFTNALSGSPQPSAAVNALGSGAQAGSVGPTADNATRMNALGSGAPGGSRLSQLSPDMMAMGDLAGALPESFTKLWTDAKFGRVLPYGYRQNQDGTTSYFGDPKNGVTLDPQGNVTEMPGALATNARIAANLKAADVFGANSQTLAPESRLGLDGRPVNQTVGQLVTGAGAPDPFNSSAPMGARASPSPMPSAIGQLSPAQQQAAAADMASRGQDLSTMKVNGAPAFGDMQSQLDAAKQGGPAAIQRFVQTVAPSLKGDPKLMAGLAYDLHTPVGTPIHAMNGGANGAPATPAAGGSPFAGPADVAGAVDQAKADVQLRTKPALELATGLVTKAHDSNQKFMDNLSEVVNNEGEIVGRNNRLQPLLAQLPNVGGFAADERMEFAQKLKNSGLLPQKTLDSLSSRIAGGDADAAKAVNNQLSAAAIQTMLDTLNKEGKPNRVMYQALHEQQEGLSAGKPVLQKIMDLQNQLYQQHLEQQKTATDLMDSPSYNAVRFQSQFATAKNQQIQATAQTGGPAKISSDADYAKLPSGAEFIAPDGSHRRKP